MKPMILLAISTIFILSSCKKDYTCNCFNPGGVFQKFNIKDTRRKATQRCNAYSKEYQTTSWSEVGCSLN